MKILLFSAVFSLSFFSLNYAYGEITSSQTITATLSPFVIVSDMENSSTSTQITGKGRLMTDLTPAFKFSTNNRNGTSATFNVKVNTSDGGQVNAIYGNDNSGIIVLANNNLKPHTGAIINALSNNPTPDNNPNAIAYRITFRVSNKDIGNVPVFDKAGNSASGNVLIKNGVNTVTLVIGGNSAIKNSFSSEDESGSYQATIYCTSVNL